MKETVECAACADSVFVDIRRVYEDDGDGWPITGFIKSPAGIRCLFAELEKGKFQAETIAVVMDQFIQIFSDMALLETLGIVVRFREVGRTGMKACSLRWAHSNGRPEALTVYRGFGHDTSADAALYQAARRLLENCHANA